MADESILQKADDKQTSMKSVWFVVLVSVLLTSGIFGGYQYLRFVKAQEAHRAAMEELERFRAELSAYIAYLQSHGTSTPIMYFSEQASKVEPI